MTQSSNRLAFGIDRRDLISAGLGAATLAAGISGAAAQTQHAQPAAAATGPAPGKVVLDQRGSLLLIGIDRPQAPYRSKPVVVAVHGGVKFGAHELFLSSDVRVAATDTRFSQGEVTRGVFPGGGATVRLVREIGWGNAMRYMLTGEEWGAEEAHRLGLVQEVTRPGKQLDRAVEIAQKIAAAAPLGVRATLASSRQALSGDEALFPPLTAELLRLNQSEDRKEFLRAVREGRAPSFRGI